jgi:hypothetical protein
VSGEDLARSLVAAVQRTPAATARAWALRADGPGPGLDWAELLLVSLQHRVEGLVHDGLAELGWSERVSPAVLSTLRRRAHLAEARYQANCDAFAELGRAAPEVAASLVAFKGARIAPLYDAPTHRMVGDFDVIVAPADAEALRDALRRLGYWEKPGGNGPTYFRDVPGGAQGTDFVALDVHVGSPLKYNRAGASDGSPWLALSEEHAIGDVRCRRLPVELELIELLNHAHEHAGSWVRATLEDDVRLIRLLDVELLVAAGGADAGQFRGLVRELGVEAEIALGLWQVSELRGGLPGWLAEEQPAADRVAELAECYADPSGELRRWPLPLRERAFRSDRAALALALAPEGAQSRGEWFDWRRGLVRGREPVGELAARARALLEAAAARPER